MFFWLLKKLKGKNKKGLIPRDKGNLMFCTNIFKGGTAVVNFTIINYSFSALYSKLYKTLNI